MSTFTPESGKAFLLEQLRLQSALDEISISDRELAPLADNTEFEDELTMPKYFGSAEEERDLLDRVTVLLHNSEKRLAQTGEDWKLTEAMREACRRDDYLCGVLWDRFEDVVYDTNVCLPQEPRTWKDNLTTLGVAIILCAALIGGIFYSLDHGNEWRTRYAEFLARHPILGSIRIPYIAWLQNPSGWFQQNAGKYLITGAVALGLVFWGSRIRALLTKKTQP